MCIQNKWRNPYFSKLKLFGILFASDIVISEKLLVTEMKPQHPLLLGHPNGFNFSFWKAGRYLPCNHEGAFSLHLGMFWHYVFFFFLSEDYVRFFLWDPSKKGQWALLHYYSIANFVASWLKWLQMIKMNSNDFSWFIRHIETHLESFQSIWSHLSHELKKLVIL